MLLNVAAQIEETAVALRLPFPWCALALKSTTFRKLDPFPSSGEKVGDTYFVGSARNSQSQSLDF
jgi:hypothetical protein